MNIEESKSLLGWVSLNKLYIDTHNECDYHNIHTAIETLLTAYEEKCKELKKEIQDDLDVRNRWGLTLQELEKEKEKNKELEKQLQSTYQKQYINDLEAINHSNVSFN